MRSIQAYNVSKTKSDATYSDIAAVFLLSALASAPSLITRFGVPGIVLYVVSFGLFAYLTVLRNIQTPSGIIIRMQAVLPFLLIWLAVVVGFLRGEGQSTALFAIFTFNCLLGSTVVLYPWTRVTLKWFILACCLIAAMLSAVTILRFGTTELLNESGMRGIRGYLAVSLSIGIGCLCAQYLLFQSFSLVRIALFILLWTGLALALGRGPFVFACLLSFLMFALVMFMQSGMSFCRKFIFLFGILVLIPFIGAKLFSIERNRVKFGKMFSDIDLAMEDAGRADLFVRAGELIDQSPIIGHGLGAYLMDGQHPHNIFYQYGIDSGYVGMILLSAFLFCLMVLGIWTIVRVQVKNRLMALICNILFFYVFLNLLKSYDAYLERSFFIFAGLLLAHYAVVRQNLRNFR